MIKANEYVSAIKPYVPGKPVEELERELGITGSVKLASNENPVGPSKKALDVIESSLNDLNRYPEGSGYYLKRKLSEKLSVSEEELILGNGSNELIDMAVRTFMKPGDEAIMARPSFVVYAMTVKAHGCNAVEVPLSGFRHDLDRMAGMVTEKTRMLFVANPNNPTGTINTEDEFQRLMEKLPDGILVVVDEAYYEYVVDPEYADSMKHFRQGRDMLVLRTFSKIYGLAGLRIGYGIAGKDIAQEMDKIRNPFNANSLAQAAALAALQDEGHVAHSREINERGKQYLYGQLRSMGIRYVPTEANFIYMLPGRDTAVLYEALLRKGVIVRPMGPEAIRVTIGLPEENKRFIEALKGAASGHNRT